MTPGSLQPYGCECCPWCSCHSWGAPRRWPSPGQDCPFSEKCLQSRQTEMHCLLQLPWWLLGNSFLATPKRKGTRGRLVPFTFLPVDQVNSSGRLHLLYVWAEFGIPDVDASGPLQVTHKVQVKVLQKNMSEKDPQQWHIWRKTSWWTLRFSSCYSKELKR